MTQKGMPAYIPGDTIRLRLDIEHQANLTEVWAVLRRQAEPGETDHPLRLSLTGALVEEPHPRVWEQLRRHGTLLFEAEVSRRHFLPGEYELEAVQGLSVEGQHVEFDVGTDVRFRIAQEPTAPSAKVTGWEFE